MPRYAFRGQPHLIEALEPRLAASGYTREGEVEMADVVITYCASTTQLEDLYFEEEGIIQRANPGTLIVDLSPTTPQFATEVLSLATISDLQMVEAPISVKDMFAEDALNASNLLCFVAGEEDARFAAQDILDVIADEVVDTGNAGTAQLRRATRTLQVAAEVVSVIESFALFEAAGRSVTRIVFQEDMADMASPLGRSALKACRQRRFDGAYTTEMLMAELSAAIMAADDFEIIIPQAESAFNMLELLALIGGADKSPAALILVYGNEADAPQYGLDWSRAEGYFESMAHDHDHMRELEAEADGYDDDYDGLDDFDDGFNYSSN